MLERTACTGRHSTACKWSTPRRPVQAAVQRQRYASGAAQLRTQSALAQYTAMP